ncbi:phage Gp37/Gp68 family protein [Kaistia dalseonensis]|uniref:Protein gp37 n=1 Tax=Kaistia dalseonensis TaxID=410840 RepID=A0ABU0H7T3_9HYPH|nr:phage Gp37/Gp68 family protein [Kaistia dalseonensis]MCX5495769.1 phage Gp37/Gp68 family protein [Kaistia dalseonensis]MDQ0438369.1 protein gp37 [Kaistia dalseonensis]
MGEQTGILWTDHTFNPWEGCQKVGHGCDHCYAETRNARFGGGTAQNWGPGAPRRLTSRENWNQPRRWNREAIQSGRRSKVFCASLADVFDKAVDPIWRENLFDVVNDCKAMDWQMLTKRIGNVDRMVPQDWRRRWPAHVWLMITVVNQAEADRDIPKLIALRHAFSIGTVGLSIEPMLGAMDIARYLPFIDWVIVGGESGREARPMHPDWVRSLRDQCAAAGVPFFFKQWGEWASAAIHMSSGNMVFRQFRDFGQWVAKGDTWVQGGICLDRYGNRLTNGGQMRSAQDEGRFPVTIMHRVGKARAGRQLDGRIHDAVPGQVQHD